jgi:hypothetical protein
MTKKFTKYLIYEIFEQQITQRELKRVLWIDQFKEAIYEYYNILLFKDDITKDEDKMEELLKDIKFFH